MSSREQFESWVSDNGKFQRALERKGGIYLLATINTQWEAWQAASKASEQQLAAVVAENAGLKQTESSLVRNIINDLGDTEFQYTRVQTPATDAYLAEVRAQGVDMFALMFAEEAIKSNNITTGWRAKASRAASEYAEALREDAAQLRQGAAL